MKIPTYATIAAATAAISPTGGEVCAVNDHILYYRPGSWFESGASGLWIPHAYRDGDVLSVYDAGHAWNAIPNSDWSWSWTGSGGGTITVNGTQTELDGTGGANPESYLSMVPPINSTRHIVYIKAQFVSGNNSDSIYAPQVSDSSKSRILRGSQAAAAGDLSFSPSSGKTGVWQVGAADFVELLIEMDGSLQHSTVFDYQTMTRQHACETASFASGAVIGDLIRIGKYYTAAACTGELWIDGFPAFVLIERKE